MNKFISIILFVLSVQIYAQDKYLIHFKDKGTFSENMLNKVADIENFAKQFISEKSIERRKKINPKNILTYEDFPIYSEYVKKLESAGINIIHKLKWFNAVSSYLTQDEIDQIRNYKFVEKVESIKLRKLSKTLNSATEYNSLSKPTKTNSYDYGSSFAQNNLSDVPAVHDLGYDGNGVIIGVLDSGFDWNDAESINHQNVIAEYDFVNNDPITEDETTGELNGNYDFHGTAVLSILGGFKEGNLIGPSFNAKFVLAKTEDIGKEVNSEEDNWAAAIEWMDSIGVDIVTSSLGYSTFDTGQNSYTYNDMDGKTTIVAQAAEFAFSKGIVVVTSAGNEGDDPWYYITSPADAEHTITVGAVTSSNFLANFSSHGPTSDGRIKPEVVAVGVSNTLESPSSKSRYITGNGTSYSAPIVAGIAGQLLSAYPHLTNKQVRQIILESGDNTTSPNNDIGYGLLSSLKAVTYPNLKKVGNNYVFNKIFDPQIAVDENSVEIVFNDNSTFQLTKNGNVFTATLPQLNDNQEYSIYISYKDIDGNTLREPADKNYKIKYGNLFVDNVLTEVDKADILPNSFKLKQNYPNPFNPSTIIEYTIPNNAKISNVSLKLFDILGREIKSLVNKFQGPGTYKFQFNASDIPSGIYFYQLKAGDFIQTKKLTILK